jgi:hypothetical protein
MEAFLLCASKLISFGVYLIIMTRVFLNPGLVKSLAGDVAA